ncbi:MAG: DUF4350 domain-containing protein [Verrucomicrobia bacterium]|nr:DUF4350 domain-containing protein [Verrucomicrobiota bacterium]
MRRNIFGTWLILAVLLICLITAFTAIMEMRFSPGDIYPHYSTKRSDPLGARAFYESLEKIPGTKVSRNIASLQRIKGLGPDTTFILLGLSRSSLKKLRLAEDSPVMEAVHEGTRLVVVMSPKFVQASFDKSKNQDNWLERREKLKEGTEDKKEGVDESEEDNEKGDEGKDEDEGFKLREYFLRHVDIGLMVPEKYEHPEDGWEVVGAVNDITEASDEPEVGLPRVFPNWHSQFRFDKPSAPWQVIAQIDDLPVVVKRPYGKGTIVLTSDSYFTSNEALWKGGDTSFLWWLIGGNPKVVFDETLHGSVESGGMMKLIRRYRLHGFFAGLFIFIALLAWSSGSSLVPGNEEVERGLVANDGAVTGEDASSGLVRLLRRSVKPAEMLDQCVEIWKKSEGGNKGLLASLTPDQESKVARLLQTRKQNPKELSLSAAYEKMVQVLSRRQNN